MKNKIIVFGIALLSFFVTQSCGDKFYDVNTNPNAVVDVSPDLILPAALAETGNYVTTNFDFLNIWMGYWNWSGEFSIPFYDRDYDPTPLFGSRGGWDNVYSVQVSNYDAADKKAATLGQPLVQGMAKIMKVFAFQYMVDTYNNVPYSDALKGTASITPKYDSAQVIYKDFMVQIDTAFLLFNKGLGTYNPNANDILFKGDIAKWKRFGNSLKLKILLRQSELTSQSTYITGELAKIKNSSYGFLGAGENAGVNPGYLKSAGKLNPFWSNYGYNESDIQSGNYNVFRANLYGINFCRETKDSFRLPYFYTPVGGSGNNFDGRLFGDFAHAALNSQISGIGPGLLQKYNQDAVIMSSHESLFDQAEAALRGWIAGDAKTLYQAAVTESFINLGVPNAATVAKIYYTQKGVANVNYDIETNKLALIIAQKWASLNGLNPFEAWCDYRRLGFPASVPVSNDPSVVIKKIPTRLVYPQPEYDLNAANVQAQGTCTTFTPKIFWIK